MCNICLKDGICLESELPDLWSVGQEEPASLRDLLGSSYARPLIDSGVNLREEAGVFLIEANNVEEELLIFPHVAGGYSILVVTPLALSCARGLAQDSRDSVSLHYNQCQVGRLDVNGTLNPFGRPQLLVGSAVRVRERIDNVWNGCRLELLSGVAGNYSVQRSISVSRYGEIALE